MVYRKDSEDQFGELTKINQTGSPETYIFEILICSVMVLDLSKPRRIFMFIYGLEELFRELLRSTRPITLQDVVGRNRDI